MIDYANRLKLIESRKSKSTNESMMDGVKKAIVAGLATKEGGAEETLKLVFKKEENPELESQIGKIGSALAMIYKQLGRPISLPKIFQVKGMVDIGDMPTVQIEDFSQLVTAVKQVNDRIAALSMGINNMPQPRIEVPKIQMPKFDFPKQDSSKLEALIKSLNDKIEGLSQVKVPEISMNTTNRLLTSLVERPVMTPNPVTNINVNALEGFVVSTDNTVGTTRVTLPNYGQLFNRRSMLIYNNSANTIYIGGSGVTAANGIPVLTNSFAPSLDAGYDLQVYGIASTSNNDVRVIEISKDQTANIQE